MDMSYTELEAIKVLTDRASTLLWITGGGLFQAQKPDFSLVLGLSRAVMFEQPSLKFMVFDIDDLATGAEAALLNTKHILNQSMLSSKPDFEYLQRRGVLYISRFVPETPMNREFSEKQNQKDSMIPLEEAGYCQLSVRKFGQPDGFVFDQYSRQPSELQPGFVEVKTEVMSMNKKVLSPF